MRLDGVIAMTMGLMLLVAPACSEPEAGKNAGGGGSAVAGSSGVSGPGSPAGTGGGSAAGGGGSHAAGTGGTAANGSGGSLVQGGTGGGAGSGAARDAGPDPAGKDGGGSAGSDAGAKECGPPCGMPSGYKVGCCGGTCTGLYNDPMNCGECGKVCPAAAPYCNVGQCDVPQCAGVSCKTNETCCGGACCQAGQICCGINNGPFGMLCYTPTEAAPTCPIGCPSCMCASPDTPIATPEGERPIASLTVGDWVYSVDGGAIVVVPIARVGRTRAIGHHVERVVLATGAVLEISAPHPIGDGRSFADLSAGSTLAGIEVMSVETISYAHAFTYDILPASDTGSYFAAGALIGSTLGVELHANESSNDAVETR